MDIRSGLAGWSVRLAGVAAVAVVFGACSTRVTDPIAAFPPSFTATGSSAIVDSMLQVSVTVTNRGTAAMSFTYGPCGLNVALYATPADSGTAVWRSGEQGAVCNVLVDLTVPAGQSRTVIASIPVADIGSGAGTYYVVAYLGIDGSQTFTGSVDAGNVTVS